MYICLCLGVTTHAVQEAIDSGARTTKKVVEACGALARSAAAAATPSAP